MTDENKEYAKKYSIIDLLWILLSHWKKITVSVLIALVAGLLLAFLVSRQYKSVARVLPPKESDLTGGLGTFSTLFRSLPSGLGKLGGTNQQYDYIAILRSRTVSEEVVRDFNLMAEYKIADSSMEKAVKELSANTEFEWTEENTLEIRVWDLGSRQASEMANRYVTLLNKRNYEVQTQEAKSNRLFLEQRLNQNKKDLFDAEEALTDYQQKHGMVVVMDPSSPAIASIADIYAQKVKKEIELGLLRQTTSPNSPQYQQTEMELKAINNEVAKFPELGVESLRLFRNVAIQQKILEFMTPLYEQAKVNEHKDVPIAYVLDEAVPGERPDRPRRIYIVGIATFLGLVLGLLLSAGKEYSSGLRTDSPDQYARLQSLKPRFLSRK